MDGSDLFVGLIWVVQGNDNFFGVWVGVSKCDIFLAGCSWIWVSATFFGGCG